MVEFLTNYTIILGVGLLLAVIIVGWLESLMYHFGDRVFVVVAVVAMLVLAGFLAAR